MLINQMSVYIDTVITGIYDKINLSVKGPVKDKPAGKIYRTSE